MGAWSDEPFGNDAAADRAFELEDLDDWDLVEHALTAATGTDEPIDSDVASTVIAAAETVAHGLGEPTQDDEYTQPIAGFATRAGRPPARLVQLALTALTVATSEQSELAELWDGDPEWGSANAALTEHLEPACDASTDAPISPPALQVAERCSRGMGSAEQLPLGCGELVS